MQDFICKAGPCRLKTTKTLPSLRHLSGPLYEHVYKRNSTKRPSINSMFDELVRSFEFCLSGLNFFSARSQAAVWLNLCCQRLRKEIYLEKTLRNSSTERILIPLYFLCSSTTLSPETMYFAFTDSARYKNLSSVGSFLRMGLRSFGNGFLTTNTFFRVIILLTKLFGVVDKEVNLAANFSYESALKSSSKVSFEKKIVIFFSSRGEITALLTLLLQRKAEIKILVSRMTFIYQLFRLVASARTSLIASSISSWVIASPASISRSAISLKDNCVFSFKSLAITNLSPILRRVTEEFLNSSLISFGRVKVPSLEILTDISFIRGYFMPINSCKQALTFNRVIVNQEISAAN